MVEVEEKVKALRTIFRHKNELLRLLANEFALTLPTTTPYNRIIERITDAGIEDKFCQRVFHAKSFDEGVSILRLRLGLNILSIYDLRDIAWILSNSGSKWRFPKKSRYDIIDAIIHNCSKEDVDNAIHRLIQDNKLDPVQQYKQWVVGPLGITESVSSRGAESSDYLVAFLSKYVDPSMCDEIIELAGFIPTIKLESSLLKYKTIQLILTYGTDKNIFRLFNRLLDMGKIRIEAREDYWSFFATPAGVFQEAYEDPVRNFADLLISHLDEETLRKEFKLKDGNLRLQIMAECLYQKPDIILDKLFGMPNLREIARRADLVATDSIPEKKELIEVLLLKLGFSVPRPPRGIFAAKLTVERSLRDLKDVDLFRKIGLVTAAYVQLERLLKDMVFFYVNALWRDEIEYVEFDDLAVLNDFIKSRFRTQKPVNRLTFGELVDLLIRIEAKAIQEKTPRTILRQFKRRSILVEGQKDLLRVISDKRKNFAHHVTTAVTHEDCVTVLTEMSKLLGGLDSTRVYPKLVLIISEVTNEYGIQSWKAIDEQNMPWTIKSSEWLYPGQHCFLISGMLGVAIDPIIVRRFWEPGG